MVAGSRRVSLTPTPMSTVCSARLPKPRLPERKRPSLSQPPVDRVLLSLLEGRNTDLFGTDRFRRDCSHSIDLKFTYVACAPVANLLRWSEDDADGNRIANIYTSRYANIYTSR